MRAAPAGTEYHGFPDQRLSDARYCPADLTNFVVILESDGKQQMIYKHAISTLIPQHRIDLHIQREERAAE